MSEKRKKKTGQTGIQEAKKFRSKNPAFQLFKVQRELQYVKNRIQTSSEWADRMRRESPELDLKKIISKLYSRQASLQKKAEKLAEEAIKNKAVLAQPFQSSGDILYRYQDALLSVLAGVGVLKQGQGGSPCESDFFEYSSVNGTEFREYIDQTINSNSDWNFEPPGLPDSRRLRFNAWAWTVGSLGVDQWDHIQSAGLVKFNFPPPPCDVVLEWYATVNIDLIMGATVTEEGDYVMVDLVIREQPNSTSFPNVGLDDSGFQLVETDLRFWELNANNHARRTWRQRLSGQFEVDSGMTSSLIMGPSVFVMVNGQASIGGMDWGQNPADDGAFFLNGMGDDCYLGTPCGPEGFNITYLMRPR